MNRFKSKILLIATIGLASMALTEPSIAKAEQTTAAPADTLSPPAESITAPNLWDLVTTGSNYFAGGFTTYSVKSHEFGGGFFLGYHVSEAVNPIFRADLFGGKLYVVSANIQLQPPRSLLGKFPITPFANAGVATAFGGNGTANGTVSAVIGIGAYMEWKYLAPNSSSWFIQHGFTAADYERWTGLPSAQQNQIRFAPLCLKF